MDDPAMISTGQVTVGASTAMFDCSVTGGMLLIAEYTVIDRARFEGVRLIPDETSSRICLRHCDLIGCDLREMSWEHFRTCFIRRAANDTSPEDLLPQNGDITAATGCQIEVSPNRFHINS